MKASTLVIIVAIMFLLADVNGFALNLNTNDAATTPNSAKCRVVCDDLSLQPPKSRENLSTSGDTLQNTGAKDGGPIFSRMTLFKTSQNGQSIVAEVSTTKNIVSQVHETSSVEGFMSENYATLRVDLFRSVDCQAGFTCQVIMTDGQFKVLELTNTQTDRVAESTTVTHSFDLTTPTVESPATISTPEGFLTSPTSDALTTLYANVQADTPDHTLDLNPHLLSLVENLKVEVAILNAKFGEINSVEQRLSTQVTTQFTSLKSDFTTQVTSLKDDFTTQVTSLKDDFTTQVTSLKSDFTTQVTSLKSDFTTQVTSLKSDFTTQFTSLKSDFTTQVRNVEQSLSEKLSSAVQRQRDDLISQVTTLKNDFSALKDDVTAQVASVKSDLTDKVTSVEGHVTTQVTSVEGHVTDELVRVEQRQREEFSDIQQSISAAEQRLNTKISDLEGNLRLTYDTELSKLEDNLVSAVHDTVGESSSSESVAVALKDDIKQLNRDIANLFSSNISALSLDLVSIEESYKNVVNMSHDLELTLTQAVDSVMSIGKSLENNTCKQEIVEFTQRAVAEIANLSCTSKDNQSIITHSQCIQGMLPISAPLQYPYPIFYPDHSSIIKKPFLCDSSTSSGGWIVIQYRSTGSESFYRDWNDYKLGFGSLDGDFWLGLDAIHQLTSSDRFELRVDLKYNGKSAYALYDSFSVGSEADNYRLEVSGYSGTAGDSFSHNNGWKFSTKDRDNDGNSNVNCASRYTGAWWYYSYSVFSNLNGKWQAAGYQGLVWNSFTGSDSATFSEMKIRRSSD